MLVYEELWSKCNDRIHNLQTELGSKIFNELVTYVGSRHDRGSSDPSRPRVSLSEIPAAALVMGVNMPDHAAMFETLRKQLERLVTAHVASLHSSKCPSLKSTILNIALQLVPSLSSQADDEDGSQCIINKSSCNMLDIVRWYNAHYQLVESASDACTIRGIARQHRSATGGSLSPWKQTSSKASAATPSKRHSTMLSVRESPRKNPTSSVVLRSGATPQKSQRTPTNPEKTCLFNGADSSPEIPSDSRNCSPEQSKLSTINGNSKSPMAVLVKTPVREPLVVLRRQESPDVNSTSPPLLTSPAKSPAKYSHCKLRASPVTTRAGVLSCGNSAEQITSPAKRDMPRKIDYIDDNDSAANKSAEQIPSPAKRARPQKIDYVDDSDSAANKIALSPLKRGRFRQTHCTDGNESEAVEMQTRSELIWCWNASSSGRPLESAAASTAEDGGVLPSVHRDGRRPPVVIVLEDFECFNSQLLQDLITICGYHINEMPVVLIFGVATTIDSIHKSLPHRVTSLLSMEKFQAPSSSDYLSMVLHRVLLNNEFPFKFGGKAFDFVLDIFLYHDFSVLGFVRTFEYAMMDHYYKHKASILCRPVDKACQHAARLSANQLADIRSCDSFQRHVKKQSSVEQAKLMNDDTYTKKEITRLLVAIDDFHTSFYPMLSFLHSLVHTLPASPLGKQLREVYAAALLRNIVDTDEYQQSLKLLRTLSRDEIVRLLSSSVELLSDDTLPAKLRTILAKLSDYRHQFDSITDVNNCDDDAEVTDSPADELPKKTSFYALRKTLQDRLKNQKDRKLTVYEKLRNETIDYIDACFREYLLCPESLVLHEVFYYNAVGDLRHRVCAAPRTSIHNALSRPYSYLKNEALNVTDGISAALPDICIIYRLHLECGRLINLYDWLQAFAAIVEPNDTNSSATEAPSISPVVQARFMRSISELQFLGFIRATKRKTDHVERLTWGL